ncbi:MAG TPA: HD-GYP domain-containing protein [Clostridium sp.]
MRIIPIECIRDGSFLGKTIYDDSGRVLLKKGAELTDAILNKVKELQMLSLYILDEYSEGEVDDIIKPELRQKTIAILKGTFANISRFNSVNNIDVTNRKVTKQDLEYFQAINSIAEELLENILSNKNILVNLVDIKSMDNYTYQHCVNVAILSLIMGIGLKLPKRALINLCVGALVHDIGKVFVSKEITNKKGPLTSDEYGLMKEHPKKGYDYLSKYYELNSVCKIITLQHHERVDGGGYPEGLNQDKINYLSKIVSIADVYDALTSDRSYRRALCASDALEYIMANVGSMFDYEMVTIFTKLIVPFPFGTIVRLSNGDIGIVQETPVSYPLRPTIKIVKSSNHESEGDCISLVHELSLVISGIEYNLEKE